MSIEHHPPPPTPQTAAVPVYEVWTPTVNTDEWRKNRLAEKAGAGQLVLAQKMTLPCFFDWVKPRIGNTKQNRFPASHLSNPTLSSV